MVQTGNGTTAEALGYAANDRLLIVNADDFGLCHSVNSAVFELLEDGVVSSASLMMPCGWAAEAAAWCAARPEADVGVHLTFTSEWDRFRWGPVNRAGQASSLTDRFGYFPKDNVSVEENADPAEMKAEACAQIEMALRLGVRPSHADNHMGSVYGLATGRHFLPVIFEVCAAYGLPFRLPRYVTADDGQAAPKELAALALQLAQLAEAHGVVVLDYLVTLPFQKQENESYESFREQMKRLIRGLRPGVTELYVHPSRVTDELKAFHGSPEKRGWEAQVFRDAEVRETLEAEGIKLIGWRELQRLQHSRK
ncbi:polysaccharide deacetylase family protein [Paenibacillus thailandensis]|uniref:Polysaccharide deacetylase family protein n=1 Tax=Paenibacillus thailandensis TaxID=393250 RepID=A0ABW5QTK6_9BACL